MFSLLYDYWLLFNFDILCFSTDGCINKSLTYLLTYTFKFHIRHDLGLLIYNLISQNVHFMLQNISLLKFANSSCYWTNRNALNLLVPSACRKHCRSTCRILIICLRKRSQILMTNFVTCIKCTLCRIRFSIKSPKSRFVWNCECKNSVAKISLVLCEKYPWQRSKLTGSSDNWVNPTTTNQPPYLRNLLHMYQPSHCLRSANQNLLSIPFCTTNLSKCPFSFSAATVSNELPAAIRESNTFVTFKRRLKTHLTPLTTRNV